MNLEKVMIEEEEIKLHPMVRKQITERKISYIILNKSKIYRNLRLPYPSVKCFLSLEKAPIRIEFHG